MQEAFDAQSFVSRLLGFGDMKGLVQQIQESQEGSGNPKEMMCVPRGGQQMPNIPPIIPSSTIIVAFLKGETQFDYATSCDRRRPCVELNSCIKSYVYARRSVSRMDDSSLRSHDLSVCTAACPLTVVGAEADFETALIFLCAAAAHVCVRVCGPFQGAHVEGTVYPSRPLQAAAVCDESGSDEQGHGHDSRDGRDGAGVQSVKKVVPVRRARTSYVRIQEKQS